MKFATFRLSLKGSDLMHNPRELRTKKGQVNQEKSPTPPPPPESKSAI